MDPNNNMNARNSNSIIVSSSSSSTHIQPPRGYALSGKIMLSAIVVLFSIVLIILFIHLYVRWHVYRRDSRRRRRRPFIFSTADRAPAPRGLDPKILHSLDVEIFASDEDVAADDDHDVAAAECAVCLCEFEDGEKVRVLPRCGHRFHIACIDMWFGSHNSCPLCRSPVEALPEAKSSSPLPQSCADGAETASQSSPESSREVRIDIEEREEGLGSKIKRYLFGELRFNRGREGDIERGEATPPATAE